VCHVTLNALQKIEPQPASTRGDCANNKFALLFVQEYRTDREPAVILRWPPAKCEIKLILRPLRHLAGRIILHSGHACSLIALPQKRLIAAHGVFFTIFVYMLRYSHTQHNNIYARCALKAQSALTVCCGVVRDRVRSGSVLREGQVHSLI
jgi:hypothetical protein